MNKLKQLYDKSGMRLRLILFFGSVLLIIMAGVTFSINIYNQRFIRQLMAQSNSQVMNEINVQLGNFYDKITQVFLTLNGQNLYEMFNFAEEMTAFERLKRQLDYEKIIKENINSNNMQSIIQGNIFYVNQEMYTYVGIGVMDKNFSIPQAKWFQEFRKQGSKQILYGPLMEDFRPDNNK